jgi:hypothetical protein
MSEPDPHAEPVTSAREAPIQSRGSGSLVCLAWPGTVAVISIGTLIALGSQGWPGTIGVSGISFCEALRDGAVKQPANTASTLGFVLVGLAIGFVSMREWQVPQLPAGLASNPMRATRFYPAFYASVAVFLGPGSAAMHASTTAWGGTIDVYSMFLWVAWAIAYAALRYRHLGTSSFVLLYIGLSISLGILLVSESFPIPLDPVFGLLVVTALGLELAIIRSRPETISQHGWLWSAVGFFLLAFAVWIPSRTGGPLCDPQSLLQGHALWHILCAGSVASVYLYLRSERTIGPVGSESAQ